MLVFQHIGLTEQRLNLAKTFTARRFCFQFLLFHDSNLCNKKVKDLNDDLWF